MPAIGHAWPRGKLLVIIQANNTRTPHIFKGMEGVDEFASEPSMHETVEPDIKCVGEIVSSAVYAKETVSKAEKAIIDKADFGDLPEQLWPMRRDQERSWMAPGPGDTVHDLSSQLLPHADRSIIIGTNGNYSFALQCADDDRVKMDPEITGEKSKDQTKNRDERAIEIEKLYNEYAKKNVAFAFKRALSNIEREAFYMALKFELSNLHLVGDAKIVLERLLDMARIDGALRSPISKLGSRLTKKINTLPLRFEKGKHRPSAKTAERPDGAFPEIKFSTVDFHDASAVDAVEIGPNAESTTFRLLICPTPTVLPSEKKTKKDKRPHWLDVNVVVNTDAKTVPACAFNDTHFVILYLPLTAKPSGVIHVDFYALSSSGRIGLTKLDRFCFRFPPSFAAEGMINLHLSQRGIVSVCFANGVLVFDAFRMVPMMHVLVLEAVKRQRRVTTAPIFHPPTFPRPAPPASMEAADAAPASAGSEPADAKTDDIWCGTVILGTDKGECYGVNWRTGKVHFIEVAPGVEPIFATHYSNGKIFMQTVMSVCGSISNLSAANQLTVLPIDRPVSMDSCGALIVILSKYGFIKILSSIARQVAREFPPPAIGSRTPLLQHAYKGIKAFHDHIVCVYPSGLVRNLVLAKIE